MSGPTFEVFTLFPDAIAGFLRGGLIGKAAQQGLVAVHCTDYRDFTIDKHRTVDDAPYGGGPGMVMQAEPWGLALDAIAPPNAASQPRLIVPTPTGRPFTQAVASELASEPWLLFACGRYEGIDSRVSQHAAQRMPVDEISIGDYVLSGGEVAVLVIVEAVARLVPGVLGNAASAAEDSFSDALGGLLESPVYTRPAEWRGLSVPAVLMSGNHGLIAQWRHEQSLERTRQRRPDLLAGEAETS